MTLKFSKQLRRFSLACLIAVGSTVAGLNQPSLYANENTPVVVTEVDEWSESNTCNFQPADNETQPINFGTHDSYPIYTRTASAFESSLAAIAATACASTGVSVEQMIEPFAMVGSHIDDSAQSVLQLNK